MAHRQWGMKHGVPSLSRGGRRQRESAERETDIVRGEGRVASSARHRRHGRTVRRSIRQSVPTLTRCWTMVEMLWIEMGDAS
jgi:hypothetical protein